MKSYTQVIQLITLFGVNCDAATLREDAGAPGL